MSPRDQGLTKSEIRVAQVMIDSTAAAVPTHERDLSRLHLVQTTLAPCTLVAPQDDAGRIAPQVEQLRVRRQRGVQVGFHRDVEEGIVTSMPYQDQAPHLPTPKPSD